jgi:hypothetical protein
MTRTFTAAILALLIATAPAHAAIVETLDANLNINYGPSWNLTGTIDLVANPSYGFGPTTAYEFSGDLALNGTPLQVRNDIPPIAFGDSGLAGLTDPDLPNTVLPFLLSSPSLPPNPTYDYFLLAGLPGSISEPTGGTVTVTSETPPLVPLPAALPLFGTALAGLAGFGWIKRRRRKVSAL